MGNFCSIVLRVIDYVLRFIFPRNTHMMLDGYNPVSEEQHDDSALISNVTPTPQIIDSYSNPGNGRHCMLGEQENQTASVGDNTDHIRNIVNNFFTIHNEQKQALSKKMTEKFFDLSSKVNNISKPNISKIKSGKEIKVDGRSEENLIPRTINKTMPSSEEVGKESASDQRDKTRALNATLNTGDKGNESSLVNKTDSVDTTADYRRNEYLTESANTINMACIEIPEYHRRKYTMVPLAKYPQDSKEIGENFGSSSKVISPDYHSNEGSKSDIFPTGEVIRDGCGKFTSSFKDILPNRDSSDGFVHDVEVSRKNKLKLRKISLNKLHSGSHYAVINNDENVELSDYSKECPPLQVEAEICFKKAVTPNLLSGGIVVFQELSAHLSIPNWYSENPIVYSEIPDGIKLPQSSPVKLKPFTFTRSFSGGNVVPDSTSHKIYLPDLFSNSLRPFTQTYSSLNTQSSVSFGKLQTLTVKTVFTDLLHERAVKDTNDPLYTLKI